MAFPVLVVDRDAALEKCPQCRGIERFGELGVIQRFGLVEQEPAIAIGAGDQRIARLGGQRQGPLERFAAVEQQAQRFPVEPLQDEHLRPAEQSGVEGEAGILGRRAHQRHRPAFDERQEAILLRTVEAVNLVHEQQRALAGLRSLVGSREGFLEIGHAAEHGADAFEAHAHAVGQQPCDGGLARTRRAPQDHARQAPGGDHPADRALGTGQVILSDHFAERGGPQAIGQRGILARRIRRCTVREVFGKEIGHWSADIGCSPENCRGDLHGVVKDIS